jgi:uncharacterized membrane protein
MGDRSLKVVAWSWVVLGALGTTIATYLTYKRATGDPLNCLIGDGCTTVAASSYAVLGGVPLSVLGGAFFLCLVVLAIAYLVSGRQQLLLLAAWLTVPGALVAWWYEYVQFYIIYAVCIYCVTSAIAATAALIGGIFLLRRGRRKEMVA